ncbi:MAG: DinB family protein [Bacteroidia bacterium]
MTLQNKIEINATHFLDSFLLLTEEQLHHKPSLNAWSILECAEHVYLANCSVSKIICTPSLPEKVENQSVELFGEGKLNHLLVNKRAVLKIPAPDYVVPKGIFKTGHDLKKQFNDVINNIITQLDKTDLTKDTQTIKHFRLGEMTKTDWVNFMIAHTNRHLLQIEEIKLFIYNKTDY